MMVSTHILNIFGLGVWAATTDLKRIKSEVLMCRLEGFLWILGVRGGTNNTWLLFMIIRTPGYIAYTFQIVVMRRWAKINLAILRYEHCVVLWLLLLFIVPYYVLEKWRCIAANSPSVAAFKAKLRCGVIRYAPIVCKVQVFFDFFTSVTGGTVFSWYSIALGALAEAHVGGVEVVRVEGVLPLELVVVLRVYLLALAELLLVLKLQILLVVSLDWMIIFLIIVLDVLLLLLLGFHFMFRLDLRLSMRGRPFSHCLRLNLNSKFDTLGFWGFGV